MLKTAQEAGFRFDPTTRPPNGGSHAFIRANPEIVAAARERECKRRSTEQRTARQQRWRATHRLTEGEGPGRRHNTPCLAGHPLLKTIQSGPARLNHLRKPVYAVNRGTVHRGHGKPETIERKNHERGKHCMNAV